VLRDRFARAFFSAQVELTRRWRGRTLLR
jgi:hypothetical protein